MDDTVVDVPDPTVTYARGGVIGTLSQVMPGDTPEEVLRHRRVMRRTAADDAIARMFQQRAIAFLLIALAPIVPGAVVLLTWGLYTGAIFR